MCAVEALYSRRAPNTYVPGEPDLNTANYDDSNAVRTYRTPLPCSVPSYKGMSLYLTQNARNDDDYVNDMSCIVVRFTTNNYGGTLLVRTKTGHAVTITK